MSTASNRWIRPWRVGILAFAALAFGIASAVCANGAFPDEFSVHFPANAQHRILIGANFGLLVSEDDGASWRYSCEPWVTSGSSDALSAVNVSFYQVTADGSFLADAVDVTRSSDVACTWPKATGAVSGAVVSDIFADPTDATFVVAIIAASNGGYIVASHDGGKTFDATHLMDTPDLLTGVETARSKAGVIYATSVSTAGGVAKFLASTDFGAHWAETTLTAPAGTQPRILAVDPADEKTVYVRLLSGLSDKMAVTADGGQTFQPILTIDGQFSSFLRASDGTLYGGTMDGKLYARPVGAASFETRNAPHLRCLGQRFGEPKRIYACGDMVLDGYSLYFTEDGGHTFTPVMKFTQLQGPLSCSPVQTNCAAHWDRIQGVLGIGGTPDAGQGGGGGGGGVGGQTPGKSGCASAGVGVSSLFLLLAFVLRRGAGRSSAPLRK